MMSGAGSGVAIKATKSVLDIDIRPNFHTSSAQILSNAVFVPGFSRASSRIFSIILILQKKKFVGKM